MPLQYRPHHLGNQRALLRRANDGSPELLSATDHYPFGMEMPGRGTTANDLTVAYSYQGAFAEKERALNWSLFDLRSYDGRLGRFHNPDPMWQYASPYMAMGNNPLSVVDPTGGWGQGGGQQSIYCPECGDTEPPAQTGTGGSASSGTSGNTGNGWGGTGSMNATEFDYWNRYTNGDDNALNHDDGPNYDPDYVSQGSPFDDGRYIEGRRMQGTTGNATQSVNGPCWLCPYADYLRNTKVFPGGVPNPFYNAEALYMDGGGGLIGAEFDGGIYFIMVGKDKGKFYPYYERAGGAGTDMTLGVEMGRFDLIGMSPEEFSAEHFLGFRNKFWLGLSAPLNIEGVPLPISIGGGGAISFSKIDKKTDGMPLNIQFGISISPAEFLGGIGFGGNSGAIYPIKFE